MSGERPVTLTCANCGSDFERSARFARMIRRGEQEQKCRRCARPAKASPVTDSDRRFWLTRFTDWEISVAAATFFDLPLRPELVAQKRAEIMGSPEPAVMMAAGVPPEKEAA